MLARVSLVNADESGFVVLEPRIQYDFTRLFDMMIDGQKIIVSGGDDSLIEKLKRAKNAKGKFELFKENTGWNLVFTKGA